MAQAITILRGFAMLHPIFAMIVFILLRAACVVYPPAPGLPFDLAALGLFGPRVGFVLAEIGIMFGAIIAFAVSRRVRRDVRLSSTSSMMSLVRRVNTAVEDEQELPRFYWWFIVRLHTNPLFDPLSYAAGLSTTSFRPFVVGTLLGNIPSIGVFFFVETFAIRDGKGAFVMVTALFCIAIWYLANRWLTPWRYRSSSADA